MRVKPSVDSYRIDVDGWFAVRDTNGSFIAFVRSQPLADYIAQTQCTVKGSFMRISEVKDDE